MKKRKDYYRSLFLIILITILSMVAFIIVLPYVWMLLTSFRTNKDIRVNPKAMWPQTWTLDGYKKVFTEAPFIKWFLNSIFVTGTVTFAVVVTSTLTGFVFAKYRFWKKEFLFYTILATMMIPPQVTMIPSFLILGKLGLYNKLGALIIPGLVSMFGIFLCRQFIEDMPNSLFEAAKIDGAGDFYIYYKVVLPLIKPAIGSLVIFTFLGSWNDYLSPLIMLNDMDRMTLPLALSFFNSQHSTDMSTTMAAAALVMMPVTIVFIAFQKQFIKGLALTGMK